MSNVAGDFVPTSGDAPKPLRLERKRVWQSVLLSVVIFVTGGVSGWGVAVVMAPPPRGAGPMGMRPDPPVGEVVSRLREELLLTADQTEKVKEIYTKRFEALKAAREEMAPKLKKEYAGLREEIEKVLTPEQFAAWDKRFKAASERMLPPPPPPRDRPNGPRNGPPGMGGEGMNGGPQDGFGPGGDGPRNGGGPGRRPPPPPGGGDGPGMGPGPGDGQGPPGGPPAGGPRDGN